MALLNFRPRPGAGDDSTLIRLPSGSFTLDPSGRVVASTVPRSFPPHLLQPIAEAVLATFESARTALQPLTELVVDFPAFKVTARELRGGAIIFLAARTLGQK
jgi:hypothetical protein